MRMRRFLVAALGLCSVTAGSGCVAVASKTTNLNTSREVAVVGGKVYVIDKVRGTVREVDLGGAQPFKAPVEDSDADD